MGVSQPRIAWMCSDKSASCRSRFALRLTEILAEESVNQLIFESVASWRVTSGSPRHPAEFGEIDGNCRQHTGNECHLVAEQGREWRVL
jgi:hypothetical protein